MKGKGERRGTEKKEAANGRTISTKANNTCKTQENPAGYLFCLGTARGGKACS